MTAVPHPILSTRSPFVNTEPGAVVAAMEAAGFDTELVEVDLGDEKYSYQAVMGRKRS